jgi:hypothetical protein
MVHLSKLVQVILESIWDICPINSISIGSKAATQGKKRRARSPSKSGWLCLATCHQREDGHSISGHKFGPQAVWQVLEMLAVNHDDDFAAETLAAVDSALELGAVAGDELREEFRHGSCRRLCGLGPGKLTDAGKKEYLHHSGQPQGHQFLLRGGSFLCPAPYLIVRRQHLGHPRDLTLVGSGRHRLVQEPGR